MRIALLGDIALFGVFSNENNHNLTRNLKGVSDYLSTFDYVVGNLETPFSFARKTYGAKSAYIYANPTDVSILKLLHLNAVTLANNHMFDYGFEGYELTKKLLDDSDIEWFGTEGNELKIENDGNKVLFAGFCCYTSNPLRCVHYGMYGVNAYNIDKAKELISQSRKEGFLPILAVHAGLEHVNYPSIDHIRAARLLSEAGSYIYYGHHPHVIQGIEQYHGSLIAHSLGNFCFDDVYSDRSTEKPLVQLSENNRRGVILELTIDNSELKTWKETPIYIGKDGSIIVGCSDTSIIEYNDSIIHINNNEKVYNTKRNKILSERFIERKALRNFTWYLKRLKPRYVNILLNARKNAKLYQKNVINYIDCI